MITGNPTDPIFKVRLLIGDTSNTWFPDDIIITHYLSENGNDIYKTAIDCLKFMKSHMLNLVSHAVGDVKIDYSRMYDQVCDLLDALLKDPRGLKDLGIVVGGTSKAEKERVITHEDFIGSPISVGFYTGDN